MAESAEPDKIWRAEQAAFIAAFAIRGTVTHAAADVGISRETYYAWCREDKDFEAACAAAHRDALVAEATRRAVDGERELVLHKGKPVFVYADAAGNIVPALIPGAKLTAVWKTRRSDALLMFLLKKEDPEYREKFNLNAKHEHKIADIPQDKSIFDVLREAAGAVYGEGGQKLEE